VRPRDLKALEFEVVVERLAALASSPGGKELCRSIAPTSDQQVAAAAIETTWQCLRLIERSGAIPLGEFPDIRTSLSRAAHEGFVLDGNSLVEVRAVLQAARDAQAFLQKHAREFPRLADLPARLVLLAPLRTTLERTLDADGGVTDDASDELAEVRRTLRRLRERLTRRLDQLLSRPGMEDLLSDRYVTVRNNRFVIPVKTGAAARIGGVVQDRSVSGETTFIEPLFAVEMNNELLIAAREEERLVRRILADLTDLVRADIDALQGTYDVLVEIDALYARARFAQHYRCTAPQFDDEICVRGARHPGLMIADRQVVPIDLILPRDKRVLVISGPNTGGKTVALKTLGLLSLMAQSGILLPVEEDSRLPCFAAVYADVGDEQSIEHSLSTFSAHIVNLIEIMDRLERRSLVLLDEPGVGTDPEEGAALGIGVIRTLQQAGVRVAVSTHFAALKVFALSEETCMTAAVQFDVETMSPRYNLVYHSVGESMALPIARRLGLAEEALQAAQGARSEGSKALSTAMERLETTRRHYEERLSTIESRERESEHAQRQSAELLAQLREKRRQRWADELRQARVFVREMRERGRRMLTEIEEGRASKLDLERMAKGELAAIERQALHDTEVPAPAEPQPEPGEMIRVANTGIRGSLLSIQGDRAWIQRGTMRFEVPAKELRRDQEASRSPSPATVAIHRDLPLDHGTNEINLIGLRTREAVAALDAFLDRAMGSGCSSVRIIHGIGSGALRRAVADYLSMCPYCSEFRGGEPPEGGGGVTIATLATA
jgi:DNA mismatch repair protein MutS2